MTPEQTKYLRSLVDQGGCDGFILEELLNDADRLTTANRDALATIAQMRAELATAREALRLIRACFDVKGGYELKIIKDIADIDVALGMVTLAISARDHAPSMGVEQAERDNGIGMNRTSYINSNGLPYEEPRHFKQAKKRTVTYTVEQVSRDPIVQVPNGKLAILIDDPDPDSTLYDADAQHAHETNADDHDSDSPDQT